MPRVDSWSMGQLKLMSEKIVFPGRGGGRGGGQNDKNCISAMEPKFQVPVQRKGDIFRISVFVKWLNGHEVLESGKHHFTLMFSLFMTVEEIYRVVF